MPHPYHLPGNLNLFQFSMPYVAEKVVDMLYNLLTRVTDDQVTGEVKDQPECSIEDF